MHILPYARVVEGGRKGSSTDVHEPPCVQNIAQFPSEIDEPLPMDVVNLSSASTDRKSTGLACTKY